MYSEDISGSIAHVMMLGEQGIIYQEEAEQIIAGLEKIRKQIASGEIQFDVNDEDIHMGIESRLIEDLGDVAKKLHTARSRNDQCQVDGRMYLRKESKEIMERLLYLESVILEKAEIIPENLTQNNLDPKKDKKIASGLYIKLKNTDCPEFSAVKEISFTPYILLPKKIGINDINQ